MHRFLRTVTNPLRMPERALDKYVSLCRLVGEAPSHAAWLERSARAQGYLDAVRDMGGNVYQFTKRAESLWDEPQKTFCGIPCIYEDIPKFRETPRGENG